MIDLGFSKLFVIGTVALIVIGPERLPIVARMAGKLYGRASSYLSQLKKEVGSVSASGELHDIGRTLADDIAEAEQDFSVAIAEANATFNDFGEHMPDMALNAQHTGESEPSMRRLALEGRTRRHRLHMSGKPSSSERWFRLRRIYRKRQTAPAVVSASVKTRGPEGIWKIV